MKIKIGLKTITHTYCLGDMKVAVIHEQTNYGLSYQPKTEQNESYDVWAQFNGFSGTFPTLESAEQELKKATKDKFQYLEKTLSTYEDIKEHNVPDNVND